MINEKLTADEVRSVVRGELHAAWKDYDDGDLDLEPMVTRARLERIATRVAENLAGRSAPAPPRETSASIAAWQTEIFGPATTTWERVYRSEQAMHCAMQRARLSVASDPSIPRQNLSRACRAAEELAELIEVLVQRDDDPAACLEVADVQIVLAGIAAAHGKDQSDLVTEKMKTNRARRWNITGDGHGQHVEDGGDQ